MGSLTRRLVAIAIVIAVLLAVIWLHHRFVVERINYANRDFMSLWTGGRAVLRGLDPYDPAVWEPLRAEYGSSWMPDTRAPFPLWTFLVMLPFALLPLSWAAASWLVFGELLLALNLFALTAFVARWQPTPVQNGLLFLGGFGSITTILVFENGQMTFLLLSLLTLYLILAERRPFWAGLVLAGILLKPNPFILFAPLMALWWLYRRRWPMVAGGLAGSLLLLVVSWLVQPGWLGQWLNVRSKTEVVTITPTVWGLAAELTSTWWLPLGLALAVLVTIFTARYLFRPVAPPEPAVVALAAAASLLTTPYTWTYEHALLLLPWVWLFARLPRRYAGPVWLALALILPWALFLLAAIRLQESHAFISPALALFLVASRVLAGDVRAPSSDTRPQTPFDAGST